MTLKSYKTSPPSNSIYFRVKPGSTANPSCTPLWCVGIAKSWFWLSIQILATGKATRHQVPKTSTCSHLHALPSFISSCIQCIHLSSQADTLNTKAVLLIPWWEWVTTTLLCCALLQWGLISHRGRQKQALFFLRCLAPHLTNVTRSYLCCVEKTSLMHRTKHSDNEGCLLIGHAHCHCFAAHAGFYCISCMLI